MGFAQAGSAVNTQRVEILAGTFRHCQCHGAGETVGIAGNERVECRILIEMRFGIALDLVAVNAILPLRIATDLRLQCRRNGRHRPCGSERLLTQIVKGRGRAVQWQFGLFLNAAGGFLRLRLGLRLRFRCRLLRHDLECREHILTGDDLQRFEQRLHEFVFKRLPRAGVINAEHDGRTIYGFGRYPLQPSIVTRGKGLLMLQQRKGV